VILRYGTYSHVDGECEIQISRESALNQGGQIKSYTEKWDVKGFLQGTGVNDAARQANLFARITALEQAYAKQDQDVFLLKSDGTQTPHFLLTAGAQGGVKVTKFPCYPEGKQAELGVFRTYLLTLEATYEDLTVGYDDWTETLEFTGGGSMIEYLEPVEGLPDPQRTKQATTYMATQDGSAIGIFYYPSPPPPIWPDLEIQPQRRIRLTTPKRVGTTRALFRGYAVSWHYEFKSATPISALPNTWPG
jgi:hypothetical protein